MCSHCLEIAAFSDSEVAFVLIASKTSVELHRKGLIAAFEGRRKSGNLDTLKELYFSFQLMNFQMNSQH